MSKGVTLVIPTYNRAELLRHALASVQRLHVPDGWTAEVLVVDNNCTDHTPAVCAESSATGPLPVRRVVEVRQGLNHGRNRGIEEAAFDHLVYLDDDMVVDPGWLEGYSELHEHFAPDAVMGPVEPLFEEAAPAWMTSRMIESVSSTYSQKGDEPIVVPAERAHELPGCNFAVLRKVAVEVGGFHPELDRCGAGMLAGGDWEFGERLVRQRKKIAYSPKCRIRHLVSRHKISREGLLSRWEGMGATTIALMRLRGEDLSLGLRIRFGARMLRFVIRSWCSRLIGDRTAAFHWELESRMLRGLLSATPVARALRGNIAAPEKRGSS
jgi:glycosyltransferase involved in cell wall biosynthesis